MEMYIWISSYCSQSFYLEDFSSKSENAVSSWFFFVRCHSKGKSRAAIWTSSAGLYSSLAHISVSILFTIREYIIRILKITATSKSRRWLDGRWSRRYVDTNNRGWLSNATWTSCRWRTVSNSYIFKRKNVTGTYRSMFLCPLTSFKMLKIRNTKRQIVSRIYRIEI